MMREKNEACPVNYTPISQTKVRLTALGVFVLSITYLFVPHWSIAGLLVTDFFLRSFGLGRYSFLSAISQWMINKFSLPSKLVDSAAKEFGALIGFIISDILFIVASLGLHDIGVYLAGMLVCFSLLEAALNICVACYFYGYLPQSFSGKQTEKPFSI